MLEREKKSLEEIGTLREMEGRGKAVKGDVKVRRKREERERGGKKSW